MKLITIIGIIVFLLIAFGFLRHLLKLNRLAKKQQSEVDPEKLRTWVDD